MTTFKAVVYHYPGNHLEKLPKNILKYLEDEWGFEFNDDKENIPRSLKENSLLVVEHDGKVIFYQFDGGEPEDQTFGRDLSWITTIINRAYKIGRDSKN